MEIKFDKGAILDYKSSLLNILNEMKQDLDSGLNIYQACKNDYQRMMAECIEERNRIQHRIDDANEDMRKVENQIESALHSSRSSDGKGDKGPDTRLIEQLQREKSLIQQDLDIAKADQKRVCEKTEKIEAVWKKYNPAIERSVSAANSSYSESLMIGRDVSEKLEQYVTTMEQGQAALYGGSAQSGFFGTQAKGNQETVTPTQMVGSNQVASDSGNSKKISDSIQDSAVVENATISNFAEKSESAGCVAACKNVTTSKEKKELTDAYEAAVKRGDFTAAQELKNQLEKLEADVSSLIAFVSNGVMDITNPYYNGAKRLAKQSKDAGRFFTDHKEAHVKMVADMSLEADTALKNAIEIGLFYAENSETRVAFSADTDDATLLAAALSHDIGMSGNGYILCKDGSVKHENDENGKSVFDDVRDNHSLNSAIYVLCNREHYREMGFSDDQVDKIAAECMAHSKSTSGVRDLNSKDEWSRCFSNIESVVEVYNQEHPNTQISFNRAHFENDDQAFGSLASETFALRIGDVSRNSCAGAESQSGEKVYVDRSTINNSGNNAKEEVENAVITIGNQRDSVSVDKSRRVHAGEQNIVNNHTYFNRKKDFVHAITIADGADAPYCTIEAISDHIGELATGIGTLQADKVRRCILELKIEKPCDNHAKEVYEEFRDRVELQNPKIRVVYPWDGR